MMIRHTCDLCYFWDDLGRCHRHAPRPSTPNELMSQPPAGTIEEVWWNEDFTWWPKTDSKDWCGEWKHYADSAQDNGG